MKILLHKTQENFTSEDLSGLTYSERVRVVPQLSSRLTPPVHPVSSKIDRNNFACLVFFFSTK